MTMVIGCLAIPEEKSRIPRLSTMNTVAAAILLAFTLFPGPSVASDLNMFGNVGRNTAVGANVEFGTVLRIGEQSGSTNQARGAIFAVSSGTYGDKFGIGWGNIEQNGFLGGASTRISVVATKMRKNFGELLHDKTYSGVELHASILSLGLKLGYLGFNGNRSIILFGIAAGL